MPGDAATLYHLGSRRSQGAFRSSRRRSGGDRGLFGGIGASSGGGASIISFVASSVLSDLGYKHAKRFEEANEGAPLTRRVGENPLPWPPLLHAPLQHERSPSEQQAPPSSLLQAGR